ncbi:actin [Tieghemostelium lacteum]|uniref:Actin n=1 Tax=Tieghemostelium lacteum TaxID=361077 RepID=A0A151ZBR5_TIELA|nr:actin [Tieghemostelium lacteum]|eukprot:KYQ91386.1 actin [Tieghemostelium lacteum]
MDDTPETIVIDNGSYYTKAGFAGDDAPRSIFPTIVGMKKNNYNNSGHQKIVNSIGLKDSYIGDEVLSKKRFLDLYYPIEYGEITDWDKMEKLWKHIFVNELRVESSEHPLIITHSSLSTKQTKDKITEIMFETFKIPSLYVADQSLMALYSSGRNEGVVLDSGDQCTLSVPIIADQVQTNSIKKMNLGGRDLSKYLVELLNQKGYQSDDLNNYEYTRYNIKEKLCYSALDFELEVSTVNNTAVEKSYELLDGNFITVGNERFRCTESLFQPSHLQKEMDGIHQLCFNSIMNCPIETRYRLFNNIILCGGNTMFDGLKSRMEKELTALASSYYKIRIISSPERKYSSFIGSSIRASIATFRDVVISKREYDEVGAYKSFQSKKFLF